MQTTTKPYGHWDSPASVEVIYQQSSSPSYPFRYNGDIYWLQALADEGGRVALMRWRHGQTVCITPSPFNIRTRVHEYGGKCFCLHGDSVIFNHYGDNRLYRQSLVSNSDPEVITEADSGGLGFADLSSLWPHHYVVAVTEFQDGAQLHHNALVSVNVAGSDGSTPSLLAKGSDFYAAPSVNRDRSRLAWIEWDQPFMPWDYTRLAIADLSITEDDVTCSGRRTLIDEAEKSVCQPGFLEDGSLVYASDGPDNDWWSLFRHHQDATARLTDETMEYGEAHWVFGQTRWVQSGPSALLAIATDHHGDHLKHIELDGETTVTPLYTGGSLMHLSIEHAKGLAMALPQGRPWELLAVDAQTHQVETLIGEPNPICAEGYSRPAHVQYHTRDGEQTFGYFYPPFNPGFQGEKNAKPPLVVMVHGGPTSRTDPSFHPLKQYFTSLGFAVLDCNHRGSTGYGRRYRQRLLGAWGEVDVIDIVDGVEYLAAEGRINPDAVFIRGSSAGGYAVLRALTCYPGLFTAGASYYGIGNLITLSEITHKFEGKYTDGLVGEPFDPETARQPTSRYTQRSPIFQMDRLQAPLILFQGLEDKVVPPDVSREVVEVLKKKGIHCSYTEYPGEGHGFRRLETRIDALNKETAFFRSLI